jgi:hypothetical protein
MNLLCAMFLFSIYTEATFKWIHFKPSSTALSGALSNSCRNKQRKHLAPLSMSITEAHWGGREHIGAAVAVGHGLRAMGGRAWARVKEARVAVERGRRSRWPEADGGLPSAPKPKEPAAGGEREGQWRPEGREPTEIGEGVWGVGHRWWWVAPTRTWPSIGGVGVDYRRRRGRQLIEIGGGGRGTGGVDRGRALACGGRRRQWGSKEAGGDAWRMAAVARRGARWWRHTFDLNCWSEKAGGERGGRRELQFHLFSVVSWFLVVSGKKPGEYTIIFSGGYWAAEIDALFLPTHG